MTTDTIGESPSNKVENDDMSMATSDENNNAEKDEHRKEIASTRSSTSLPQASPRNKTTDASAMAISGRSKVRMELDMLRNKNLAKTHKGKFKGSSVALSAEETLAFLQAQKQKQKQSITPEMLASTSSADAILGSWYHQQRALISSEKQKKIEAEANLRGYRAAHHEKKKKAEQSEREWKTGKKYFGDVDAKSKIYAGNSSSSLSDLKTPSPKRGMKKSNDVKIEHNDDEADSETLNEFGDNLEMEISETLDINVKEAFEDENDEAISETQNLDNVDSSPNLENPDTAPSDPLPLDTEHIEEKENINELDEEEKKMEADADHGKPDDEIETKEEIEDGEKENNIEVEKEEEVQQLLVLEEIEVTPVENCKVDEKIVEEMVISPEDVDIQEKKQNDQSNDEEVEDEISVTESSKDDEVVEKKNDATEEILQDLDEKEEQTCTENSTTSKEMMELLEVESEDYSESRKGIFEMNDSCWRNYISQEENALFPPEKDRYHLYVSLACPWAHRTMLVRALKGLENIISYTSVHPVWKHTRPDQDGDEHRGWVFTASEDLLANEEDTGNHQHIDTSDFPKSFDGNEPDAVNQCSSIREVYEKSNDVWGKYTVPILWDKSRKTIVSNDSSDIIRMLNSEFNVFALYPDVNLYPESKMIQIDALNAWIYPTLNNGVYQCGLATTQSAYMEAVKQATNAFDQIDNILSKQRFLAGDHITEADVRLFPTLLRFDEVYNAYFKVNSRMVEKSETLLNYCRDIYQIPGVLETCDMEQIKHHYYCSHKELNRFSIVPIGTGFMKLLDDQHNREQIAKVDLNDSEKIKDAPNINIVFQSFPGISYNSDFLVY